MWSRYPESRSAEAAKEPWWQCLLSDVSLSEQWEPGHTDRPTSPILSACNGDSPPPSVSTQSQRILGEIARVDWDYMNLGEWDEIWGVNAFYWLRLVMLYFHGEEFYVLCYVTDYLWPLGCRVSGLTSFKAGMETGRELAPLLPSQVWYFWGLSMFHLTNSMAVPLLAQSTCPTNKLRLALNSQFSCLSFLWARFTCICHHVWLFFEFFFKAFHNNHLMVQLQ